MSFGGGSKKVKPTDAERSLAETGARQWNRNVTAFQPITNEFVQGVRTDSGDRAQLARGASAAAASQFASAAGDRGVSATGLRAGLAPSAIATRIADSSNRYATALGMATGLAEPGLVERETRGLLKASAIGRGLADNSQIGLSQIGQATTQAAINRSRQKSAYNQAVGSAIAGLAGAGAGAAAYKLNQPKSTFTPEFFPLDG